jgi:putative endonuclease
MTTEQRAFHTLVERQRLNPAGQNSPQPKSHRHACIEHANRELNHNRMSTNSIPAHLQLGTKGEDVAVQYLRGLGYRIIDRNVRLQRQELDVVAFDVTRAMMVFVEVKTRAKNSNAYPIRTAVDYHKRRCLSKAVQRWVNRRNYDGPGRIDIVCVMGDKIVEHLMDIGSDFY